MTSKKDIFLAVYRDMLFGISIAQWRNIACHSDYSIYDEKVKVRYGERQQNEAAFLKKDIEQILHIMNALLYMHKTIFTLLAVDFRSALDIEGVLLSKSNESLGDDIIAQIAESAYVFGLLLVDLDKDQNILVMSIRRDPISNEDIDNFLRLAFSLLNKNFKVLICSGSRVKFEATIDAEKLSIMEYVCKSHSL